MTFLPPPRPARAAHAALALSALAGLAGCGQLPLTTFEGRYAMRDGWHRATVDRIVATADLPALLRPDCPAGVPPAQALARQWVLVDYRPAGRARQSAVPLAAGAPYTPGMPVYVRVQDCTREIAPRGTGA